MGDPIPLGVGPPMKAGSGLPLEWVQQEQNQDSVEPRLGFQFVTETGLDRPKGSVLSLIRSQARRRNPRRKKSQPKRVTRLLLPSNKWKRTNRHCADPDLSDHHTLRNATLGTVDRGPTCNWFDPFNALPIEKRGHSHYLISRYDVNWYPDNNPYAAGQSFSKEDVLHFAVSDAAVLHIILSHIARTLYKLSGANSNLEAAYHLGQGISLVNKRIANCHHEAVTNATIFAVGCLAHKEIIKGCTPSLKMHLDGLEALVKITGGIEALISDPLVFKFTYWIDKVGSIAMGSKPRFDLRNLVFNGTNPGSADLEPCTFLALRYKSKLSSLTGLQYLAEETIEAYRMSRYLMAQKDKNSSSQKIGITKVEFESYSDQLMHQLIAIVQYKFPVSLNQNAFIYGLFGNAALAHVTTFVCNPLRRGSILELLSMRIRASLEVINLRSFQIAYPEMMLWIIMVGGLAGNTTDNQAWFAKLFADSCLAAGIKKTTELALVLKDFLWSDSYLDPICKEFWDDFTAALAVVARNELGESG